MNKKFAFEKCYNYLSNNLRVQILNTNEKQTIKFWCNTNKKINLTI